MSVSPTLPKLEVIEKILTGEPLAPMVPKYKKVFDTTIPKLFERAMTEEGKVLLQGLCEGILTLQLAIENKTIYRKDKTWIPQWVYWVLDKLGCGAVGQAERELNRVISSLFQEAMKHAEFKEVFHEFLDLFAPCYLRKHLDHPLMKEISKVEAVEAVLMRKGIVKTNFDTLLAPKVLTYDQKYAFKDKLRRLLSSKYDNFVNLQFECTDAPGVKFNLLQLAIKHKHDDLAQWIVEIILFNCSVKAAKEILTQNDLKVSVLPGHVIKLNDKKGVGHAIQMLAKRDKLDLKGASVTWPEGAMKPSIIIVESKNPLMRLLMAIYNELSWPKNADAPNDIFYCDEVPSKWRSAKDKNDRNAFLKQLPNL